MSPKVYLNDAYKMKDGKVAVYILVHIDNQSLKFPTVALPQTYSFLNCYLPALFDHLLL